MNLVFCEPENETSMVFVTRTVHGRRLEWELQHVHPDVQDALALQEVKFFSRAVLDFVFFFQCFSTPGAKIVIIRVIPQNGSLINYFFTNVICERAVKCNYSCLNFGWWLIIRCKKWQLYMCNSHVVVRILYLGIIKMKTKQIN